jgi:hypothetical protein
MSDSGPGGGTPPEDDRPAGPGVPPRDPASVILDGLGERRDGPRIEVQLPCSVYIGSHVQDGMLRDVSLGGAMVHGVRGMLAGDLVRLRLARPADYMFVAEVRAVSLLGVHLAIQPRHLAVWREAIIDFLPGASAEGPR